MRPMVKLTMFFAFVYVFLLLAPSPSYTEKIGPSRTLDEEEATTGTLSVFSEPPGLAVSLDGKKVGMAPVDIFDVQPGTHSLQVENVQTEVLVVAGKTHQFSFFKGTFIETPEATQSKKVQKNETAQTNKKNKLATGIHEDNRAKEESRPLYWPLNPRGPMY